MLLGLSPIQKLQIGLNQNNFYVLREDLLGFSFGGNKIRIGMEYLKDAKKKGCDCMIAYGSSSSNMCRVIANLCARESMECYVVSSVQEKEEYQETHNSHIVELLGAHLVYCKKSQVAGTLNQLMTKLKAEGKNPYYIYGDILGKGTERIGIEAYKNVYQMLEKYQEKEGLNFDFIFHASGTGSTQAGLVLGKTLCQGKEEIIGISVAREKETGRDHILNLLSSAKEISLAEAHENLNFEDAYLMGGYGKTSSEIIQVIQNTFLKEGIPLDITYTGKAFYGMEQYIKEKQIYGKNILFIHTGGTPLFFDFIRSCVDTLIL